MSEKTGGTNKKIWLAIGDIHDDLTNLSSLPKDAEVEGILIHGDLTNDGGAKEAEKIIGQIGATGFPVLAQVGNMDLLSANDWLEGKNINLHGHTRELAPQVAVLGIGGSTFTPMHTPTEFSEDEYAAWLELEWEQAKNYQYKILVSHNPPKNTKCDDLGNGVHVGSQAVRDFLEKYQPDICICGHIHEAKGVDRLGRTIIINPGAFADGGYARITLDQYGLSATLENAPS